MAEVFLSCSYSVVIFYHLRHPRKKAIFMCLSLCGLNCSIPKSTTHHPICCARLFLLNKNATNAVFSRHLWWIIFFSLSFFFFSSSVNQINFLHRTTAFKKTTRADACQVFPDAPKQWLHSWQIPLILNLIRHRTVAYSVLCGLESQAPFVSCLLSLRLCPLHRQLA